GQQQGAGRQASRAGAGRARGAPLAGGMLSKADLFARLAAGHAARITVVTPNKRLSQELQKDFDSYQIGKGLSVWEAPDILPFGAFVQRLYEDGLYSDLSAELPMLLTPAQEE